MRRIEQKSPPRSLVKTSLHIATCCIFGRVMEHFEGDYGNSGDDFSLLLITEQSSSKANLDAKLSFQPHSVSPSSSSSSLLLGVHTGHLRRVSETDRQTENEARVRWRGGWLSSRLNTNGRVNHLMDLRRRSQSLPAFTIFFFSY